MSNLKPGTVAVATVRGEHGVRVMRTAYRYAPWTSAEEVCDITEHDDLDVVDARPLVVLDLDEGDARMLPRLLRRLGDREQSEDDEPGRLLVTTAALRLVADQIEAQTKPPRIPEPGWGAFVEAGVVQHDVRLRWGRSRDGKWECVDPAEYDRLWDELIDPVLVRDGIGGGAK